MNTNNPSPIEITINEDSSLLDNTQFPDPSVNQYSKADLTLKPKEVNDMLRDENKALNSKFDNELNINSEKNRHLNPEKGITPCPFLKRRGWCVKGARCDFKHPRDVQKHLVPCPFLQKRGFCLKGVRCEFSHSFSYPYCSLPSRPVNKYITPSFFHHDRSTVASQGTTHGIGANQFSQNYPRRQGFFSTLPKTFNGPSLLLSNTMSLAPKIDEITLCISEMKPDLACFTETWLHDGISTDCINISGYNLIYSIKTEHLASMMVFAHTFEIQLS